jgi:osmotically-inducible protein OsmY
MKSQETLQLDVVDELAWDPAVDSSAIGITVLDGIVTLTGNVVSYAEKIAAEKAARRVSGVKAVVDNLEVTILPPLKRDDGMIAEAASNALRWNVNLPAHAVSVTVERGWIKLEGTVPWQYQKESAANVVRYLHGVRGVTNLIVVKPVLNARDVKSKIEAAFKRNAQIDADHVIVTGKDGKVTLNGTVRSWAEYDEAEAAAWSAPGVSQVKNEIIVQVPVSVTSW